LVVSPAPQEKAVVVLHSGATQVVASQSLIPSQLTFPAGQLAQLLPLQ
jgi:hypothetical protein